MIQKGKKLEAELAALCDRNRDGSYVTQANRRSILQQMSDDLARANFDVRKMSASDIKGRHVRALLDVWRRNELSTATIKNRLSVLRWWAEKIGNPGAVWTNEKF